MAICSLSPKYLQDFQEILLKFNITSKINGDLITVFGKRNLRKIENNFTLVSKDKIIKLKEYRNKLNQSPKGMSLSLYLGSLNKLKEATWIQIRDTANRVGNSSRVYRDQLLEREYIQENSQKWPKTYKTTKKGKRFLKENEIYWL